MQITGTNTTLFTQYISLYERKHPGYYTQT